MFLVSFQRVLSSQTVRSQSKWIFSTRSQHNSTPINSEHGSEVSQDKVALANASDTSTQGLGSSNRSVSFPSPPTVFGHNSQLNFDLVSQLRAESTLRLPMLDPRKGDHPSASGQEDSSGWLQFSQSVQLEGCSFKLPSVSAVINDTMSAESLARLDEWKRGMIAKLSLEGFEQYQKAIFSRGRKLHKNLEYKLAGKGDKELNISKDIEGCWQSLQHVFDGIGSVRLLEQRVVHPLLLYRGIVDCVATVGNTLHVIDWKTSEKSKDTIAKLYDAPVQAVAYLGALNYDMRLLGVPLKNVAIVVAYEDGRAAHVHRLSEQECTRFWKVWMQRLHEYWAKRLPKPIVDSQETLSLAHTDNALRSGIPKNVHKNLGASVTRTHARSSTLKTNSSSKTNKTILSSTAPESASPSSSCLKSNISLQLNSLEEQLRFLKIQVKNLQTTVGKLKEDSEKQLKSEVKKK